MLHPKLDCQRHLLPFNWSSIAEGYWGAKKATNENKGEKTQSCFIIVMLVQKGQRKHDKKFQWKNNF